MQSQLESKEYTEEMKENNGVSRNVVYAGFFVRLVAYVIDSLIALLAVGIIKFPFSIVAASGVSFLNANFIFHHSFLDVLGYVGVAAYFVLLTYFSHSTPGKMLFRLEVVTKTGEWTFLNVLYRETVGRFLSSILCIGYLAVLVTQDKQGFHDMLCDTNVVYAKMMPVPVVRKVVTAGNTGAVMVNAGVASSTVNRPISAFQMEESHPVEAEVAKNAPTAAQSAIVDTLETSKSFDNVNPDCKNLESLKEDKTEI